MSAKRAYGTGSLLEKHGAWYGRWRTADGRRLQRRIGPVRTPGGDEGLTRREAEQQFRKLQLVEEPMPTRRRPAGTPSTTPPTRCASTRPSRA